MAGVFSYVRMAARLPVHLAPKVDFGKVDVALASLLTLLYVVQIFAGMGQKITVTSAALVQMIAMNFCVILTILGVLIGRDRNPIVLFGLSWPGWRSGIFFALGALLAVYPLVFLPGVIAHVMGVQSETQPVLAYLATAEGFGDRFLLIFAAVVAAPLAEEVIFRGYLHGILRRWTGRWFSIIATSLLFGAIHVHLPVIIPLAIFGFALVLVYEKTKSLWAPIVMHVTFNAVTVIVALAWPDLLK